MTIETAARELIGVPWVHQGRTPQGVDCVGLGVLALRSNGITVLDRQDYSRDPDGTLRAELTRVLGPAVASGARAGAQARPGDVVLMTYPHTERHVGIVSQDAHGLTLIHADSRRGAVVEHRIDHRWNRRIVGVWRSA